MAQKHLTISSDRKYGLWYPNELNLIGKLNYGSRRNAPVDFAKFMLRV